MRRVRQGLLPESHPRGAQDPAHGGVAAQVPGVRAQLQSAQQPQDPPAHPHGHQAVSLRLLRQGVPAQLRSAPALAHPQSRRHGEHVALGLARAAARRRPPRWRRAPGDVLLTSRHGV